jgi:hypothetical protein
MAKRQSQAIAIVHKEEILAKVRSGFLLREIAAEYGVTKQALHAPLRDDPDYRDAIVEQAESLIEDAKIETWAAREALDIARAREMAKFAFRYGEAVNPDKWAAQSKVSVTHTIDLGERLRRAKERTIDGERVADTPIAAPLPLPGGNDAQSE